MAKFTDLTGKRFGMLTVVEMIDNYKDGSKRWRCKCDCGKETKTRASALIRGNSQSCGCRNHTPEMRRANGKMAIKDLKGKKFGRLTVVRDSGERDNSYVVWICKCDCGNTCKVKSGNLLRGSVKSCGCLGKETQVSAVDSARKKLRAMDYKGTNISLLNDTINKNNTSGIKGVSWSKASKKWLARITLKKKSYYLGIYDDIDDAIKARKLAEEKLFHPITEEYNELRKDDNDV